MQINIKKLTNTWITKFRREVADHPLIYVVLFLVLAAGIFIRVYRVDAIMGFYYDQGRDAQVIWDFWHKGEMFLVGPTTGIAGIFRGPWYYWLIAPFYLIGGGDPGWPAIFLSLTTVVAVILAYIIACKIADRVTGLFAVVIASLSYYMLLASRWLSNPTPMLLISMFLVFSMFLVMEGKKWAWLLIGFLIGMAMQFGSAAEVFYFPAVVIFAIWQRRNLGSKKIMLLAFGLIVLAFVPQVVFDIVHHGVLSTAVKKFLFDEGSFKLSFWEIVKMRIPFYKDVFLSKVFPGDDRVRSIFLAFITVSFIFNFKKFWNNKYFKVLLLLLISPLIGVLFFQGNYGNVYGYYFTGYFLIFILIFSILVFNFVSGKFRYFTPAVFLILFLNQNLVLDRNYIVAGSDGPTTITLENELEAVNWVISDALREGKPFNVDSYVPPVIPYTYDYLFTWQATKRCGVSLCGLDLKNNVQTLYTTYETDPPHPERLNAWLARQKGIGRVENEVKFGGVSAQRRVRIK